VRRWGEGGDEDSGDIKKSSHDDGLLEQRIRCRNVKENVEVK
jgi:hypothetical protein